MIRNSQRYDMVLHIMKLMQIILLSTVWQNYKFLKDMKSLYSVKLAFMLTGYKLTNLKLSGSISYRQKLKMDFNPILLQPEENKSIV